jgi:hypothetical protein
MATKPFPKGKSANPRGRRKGSVNKFTTLKASFLEAFNDERIGGTEGLILWILKTDHNRGLFYQWITKMLPSQTDVDVKGTMTFKVSDEFLPKEKGNGGNGHGSAPVPAPGQ